MKVLVTGASGFLGAKVYEILSRRHEVAGTCHRSSSRQLIPLDIRRRDEVDALFERGPVDVCIHTAGSPDPDWCEQHRQQAWELNVLGTKHVADACLKHGVRLVYVSTDYVFPGDGAESYGEDDPPRPVQFYGRTKLEGERIAAELPMAAVVRIPVLYGYNYETDRATFVPQVVQALGEGRSLQLDDHQVRYPTAIDDVAAALEVIASTRLTGIFHVTAEQAVTKVDWARRIASEFGLSADGLTAGRSTGGAPRPEHVRLRNDRLRALGVPTPVPLDVGLRAMHRQRGCAFRLIYSVRPDMLVLGQNASAFRIEVGKRLAREAPAPDANLVVGVPESGLYGATGFSAESGVPFHFGIIRDYFTRKTLFEKIPEQRSREIEAKLIVVPELVEGRSVVLMDEAIISGSTLRVCVAKLKRAGARAIHVRIPAPMMLSQCRYRVLDGRAYLAARELVDFAVEPRHQTEVEAALAHDLEVDSVRYLSLAAFAEPLPDGDACVECFHHEP